MLRRGNVYWARLPGDKRRPALVVSPEERNANASDVIVVPLSTTRRFGPWHVALRRGEGGVPLASIVKCEHITTVPRDVVEEPPLGAALAPVRMEEVERAILRAIGVPA